MKSSVIIWCTKMRGESQTWSFDDPYNINQRDIHRGQKWKKENSKLRTLADKRGGKKVDFRVTSEHTGDSKKFVPLVWKTSKKTKITKVQGDMAYDARRVSISHINWR